MIGLLICAAVAGFFALWISQAAGMLLARKDYTPAWVGTALGLALIAAVLWLAYAAGGA